MFILILFFLFQELENKRILDVVPHEVGVQARNECRENRFAFLELAKGTTFKISASVDKNLYILDIKRNNL